MRRWNLTPILILAAFIPEMAWGATSDIVITEIGAYEAGGHEWVEVFNRGAAAVDLTGWVFWEGETNHRLTLKRGADMALAPGEYAVITQDDVNFTADYPRVAAKIFDSSWGTINESGEELGLKDAGGVFGERFTYIAAANFSLERKDAGAADYSTANWREHPSGNTVGGENYWRTAPTSSPGIEADRPRLADETSAKEAANERNEKVEKLGNERNAASDVVINELVSDPADGEVEFVELYNRSGEAIILDGWWIEEGGGAKTILRGVLPVGGFFVIEAPRGNLNNAGDLVKLFAPAGILIDRVAYGNWDDGNRADNAPRADDPLSLARSDDGRDTDNDQDDLVLTTSVTPGAKNIINKDKVKEGGETVIKSVNQPLPAPVIETSTEAAAKDSSALVSGALSGAGAEKVEISEFIPDPIGSDEAEFIELFNPTGAEIDLSDFKLDDEEGGSRPFTFPSGTRIGPGEYLVWGKVKTKLVLNNTTDSVRLISLAGAVIQEVAYENVPEGASYARDEEDEVWVWTNEPTPGHPNAITTPETKKQKNTATALGGVPLEGGKNKKTPVIASRTRRLRPIVETTIEKIREFDVGDRVKVTGVVAVLPGVLGAQYFYLVSSNTSSPAGVQVYQHAKDFPALTAGERVTVTGEISEAYGERRVKAGSAADIQVVSQGEKLIPLTLAAAEIGDSLVGALVEISGEITEKKSSYFYLDDGSEEARVYLKAGAGIARDQIVAGQMVRVAGIVSARNGQYQLLPRGMGDIVPVAHDSEEDPVLASDAMAKERDLAETYLTATAGGLTSILIGLMARARGARLLNFFKRRRM